MTLVREAREAIAVNQVPKFWIDNFAEVGPDEAVAEARELGRTFTEYAGDTYDLLADVWVIPTPRDEFVEAMVEVMEAYS